MPKRFTYSARRAVAFANHSTQRLGGYVVGDVELLLALALEPSGVCKRALDEMGIDLKELQNELEKQPRSPEVGCAPRVFPQTPEYKLAIEAAVAASQESGDQYVGTEHLLLGLLRYPEFTSSRVLGRAVSMGRARDAIAVVRTAGAKDEE